MRHTYIEIKNFKGINHVRLDLDSQPRSNIYTLVGLNESGKTTILEAISFISYEFETLKAIEHLPGYFIQNIHELIPIGKRSNFNESTVIEAGYNLDEDDNKKIKEFCLNELKIELIQEITELSITISYDFKGSEFQPYQPPCWDIKDEWTGKSSKGRRANNLRKLTETEQLSIKGFILESLMPNVIYFPNFLFEFPDRIYLEEDDEDDIEEEDIEEDRHEFYRTILQDVLDAIGEQTNIKQHILQRAKANDSAASKALKSVLLKMGTHISYTVFSKWDSIFKRTSGNKEIVITCEQDDSGLWFLQLSIKDSNELYTINERSLGFRWFFTFLLLTQYRVFRKGTPKNTLFLLDEPASNLHSSAQAYLVKSFGEFPEGCSIIYTTHSHYMINPDWLESTFIVKNEGLNYDEEDKYKTIDTDIKVYKYREFVSNHPDQTTYFKPILDVLEYCPGKLENVPNVVMVEGKNDFYTLKYFQEKILDCTDKLNLMPGGGAGSLKDVIRLYLAWGREFIVLLDADEEGLTQKKRYEELFGVIVNNRIFSLEDIDGTWKRIGTEFLLEEEERIEIQTIVYPKAIKFNKIHFNRAIQELYLTNKQIELSTNTKAKFENIFAFCVEKLGNSTQA